jgi:hypothetical protein
MHCPEQLLIGCRIPEGQQMTQTDNHQLFRHILIVCFEVVASQVSISRVTGPDLADSGSLID